MKIIFLNGAPGSGKDTSADVLMKYLWDSHRYHPYHLKFATPLKKAAHALFGLSHEADDSFEGRKELGIIDFAGYSPREIYIAVSEQLAKPLWGKDFFGKIFMRQVKFHRKMIRELCRDDYRELVVVCSDCGFLEEIIPSIEAFGAKNCLLIRIERDGCDFKNDSRSFVYGIDAGIEDRVVRNNGTYYQLSQQLVKSVKNFL